MDRKMKKIIIIALIITLFLLAYAGWQSIFGRRDINIAPLTLEDTPDSSVSPMPTEPTATAKSSPTPSGKYPDLLTGTNCQTKPVRPVAVMLSSDPEARALAGISEADLVFEMPVINQVTRLMAVFSCHLPRKIGSIRSARNDFLSYAFFVDAILVHFGGEHEVLQRLDSAVINNIDCIKLDGTICLRDSKPRPNNAYTTADLIKSEAKILNYDISRTKTALSFRVASASSQAVEPPPLYTQEFTVRWRYSSKTNKYLRSRNNLPEIDSNTRTQVAASNVVILRTTEQKISYLYNRVKTVGSGPLKIYAGGSVTEGSWKKTSEKDSLQLLDKKGNKLDLNPGITWFEIVTADPY